MRFELRAARQAIIRHRREGTWRTTSIVDDLLHWADETPDSTMLFADTADADLETISYREMSCHTAKLAGGLARLGAGPGTVVSAQLPNRWQAAALALATWRRGAVWAPIMTSIAQRERDLILAALEPQVFIGDAPCVPSAVRHVVVNVAQLLDGSEVEDVPVDPDLVALVLFTSGTTGAPKGALKTLNNVYAATLPLLDEGTAGRPRSIYTPQTLMHGAALNFLTNTVVSGSSLLISDRWNPARVAGLIEATEVDQMMMVPSMLAELLGALESGPESGPKPASTPREVILVGSPVPPPLLSRAVQDFGLKVRSGWGMTEGGLILTPLDAPANAAAHSLGRAGRGTEIALRPATPDAEINVESPGQMWMRGAAVCVATIGRDNGEVRVVAEHDDGWYDTGDLVVPDGEGGYRLLGRKADRIGGAFMIPVADVENALLDHPAISDVAIVGHRDVTEGCAFVVSTEPIRLPDLHSYLEGIGMTEWYWPTRIELVDELPRNAMGKVDKFALRNLLDDPLPSPSVGHVDEWRVRN